MTSQRRQSTPASLLVVGGVLGILAGLLLGSGDMEPLGAVLATAAGSFWFVGLVAIGVRMGLRRD